MRRPVWAWLALSSAVAGLAPGAVRPHYGGTLTVELSTAWSAPDAAQSALSLPIAETLVRVTPRGDIEPVLAVSWQHDPDFKRWRFSLRPKVTFQDGEALTAASAAPALQAALKQKYPDVSFQTGGQLLVVQCGQPMPALLEELAAPQMAIVRKSDSDPLIGTAAFRITSWEPGRRLTVAAFDDYWGGRPFLDAIAIEFGAGHGRADLSDIPAGPARRILPEGVATWSSSPRTLLALASINTDPTLLQALALVIDRAPIVNVLAQRKGEAAFSALPQWLSGIAFLFQTPPDVARARQMVSQLRATPLALTYPPNDAFLRSVAERIALNARDAGISIQPTTNPNGNLRLVQFELEAKNAASELKRIAGQIGPADRAAQIDPEQPETLYQAERSLLQDHRFIPLVHLRKSYAIAPRVRFQPSSDMFWLHLENAWIQP